VFGRAAPCTCRSNGKGRSNSRSWLSVGWRGGSGCGGRREPVLGGLAAASMPRTPPQPHPPRLRQFPAMCLGGVLCCWWVSTLVDTVDPRHAWMGRSWGCVTRHFTGVGFLAYGCMERRRPSTEICVDRYSACFGAGSRLRGANPPSQGNRRRRGRVRVRGRERHGWRDRAYMDVLAASPAA
jgi:hypothetical protein